MKAALILSVLAGAVMSLPQAVTDTISPVGAAPTGCSDSYSGSFQIAVASIDKMNKRDITELQKRSTCGEAELLEITLADGVLKDSQNRTGYIASNYQFQFDDPPQAGSIYTAGFSVCSNSSLALGASAVWYQCLSGDFYNLYTSNWAEQCEPIGLVALACDGTAASADEVVLGTDVALPICQIGDGQIQAHTTPCVTVTTPTAGITTTYEVSTPVVTTPAMTTAPTTVPAASSGTNTTVTTPSVPAEISGASSTETGTVNPTQTPSGTSGVARLSSSAGSLIIGLVAAFSCL